MRRMPHPLKRAVLQRAALASPIVKTQVFERFCRIVAASLPNSGEMCLTNLGLTKDLRCNLPLAKAQYVFGRPKDMLPERATLALAMELCRDCAHFVDVGANDGLFTFAVARRNRDIALHWFEPDSAVHGRLEGNLAANAIRARGNKMAVADRRGRTSFFGNPTDDFVGSLHDDAAHHDMSVQEVETISLSDYFGNFSISDALVKIDVEGAGAAAWSGTRTVAGDIRYLIMEIIGRETECELPKKIISEGGFSGFYIRDFHLIHSRDGSYNYAAPFWNWLFTHLSPEQLERRLLHTSFRVS